MPPAIIAGAIVGTAAVGSAVIGSKAAGKASDAATTAATNNNELQRDIYAQNLANETPWMTAGQNANSQITGLLNGDQSAFDRFRNSTNYKFAFDQGTNALNTNYALKGVQGSGAADKALVGYGAGMAGNSLGQYYGMLNTQAQRGLGATNALAGVGTDYANAVSSNNNNAASATGNAALASGNALSNGINGVAGAFNLAQGYNSSYGTANPGASGISVNTNGNIFGKM